MLQYLGIFAAIASWACCAYLLFRWKGHKAMSISEHAASSGESTKFFAASMLCCSSLFYLWVLSWLSPHLRLPMGFSALVYVSAVLVCALLLFPDSTSVSRVIHRCAAYGMALLYLPMSVIVITAPELASTARIIGGVLFGYMVFACFMFLFYKKSKSHYLVFQAMYIIAFQGILLAAGYF